MCLRRKRPIIVLIFLLMAFPTFGQFWDSATGLLQCPSADMNREGTFMITNNFVNEHSLSSRWGYHTFGYGFNITFWSRLEVGYVCVIFDGKRHPNPSDRDLIMFNQDRHAYFKLLLLKEGEFGLKWLPGVAVGVSDPTSGGQTDYKEQVVSGTGNGYFNRNYIIISKHFPTKVGAFGAHLGYQFNRRADMPINGPCAALDWAPVWLDTPAVSVKFIAEYDARTFNAGFIASFWDDRFEAMFELMAMKWVNFGVRYKLVLKK